MAANLTTIDELLESWPDLEEEERVQAFRDIPREFADDFFLGLDGRSQLELIQALPNGERRIWVRLLPPDDAADLIQLAASEEQPELMAQLDDVSRREVSALLAFKED